LESFIDEDAQSFNLAGDWQSSERTAVQVRGYFSCFDEITNSNLLPSGTPIPPGNLFKRLGKVDGSVSRAKKIRGISVGSGKHRGNPEDAPDESARLATASDAEI
jgi:hypothetical protein